MATSAGSQSSHERFRPDKRFLNWVERLSDTQFVYLMLTPIFLLLGVMAIWPIARTFQMSLHADLITSSTSLGSFIGPENYVRILSGEGNALLPRPFFDLSQPFTSALSVTLIFTIVAVVIETILGFGQALVLDKSFRGRRWVRVALVFPWTVPIVIQGLIFYLIFQPGIGFAVEPLQNLGLVTSAPLSDPQSALLVVILSDIWRNSAFMALLILAGLQSIDRDLYNVAKVTGASKLQQFRTITLPLVMPALLVALIFRTIGALKVFGSIETISNCSTVPSLSCLVISTWNSNRLASAATIATLTAVVVALVLLLYLAKMKTERQGAL